jgi:tetratricopeptide (TPR) repeat protein
MGQLLIRVGQLDKAEQLYKASLEQTSKANDQGRYYHQLGSIKGDQVDYKQTLSFYEQALEIWQKCLPPIIQIWLPLTPTSVAYMTGWASTRQHCPSTNDL